MNKNQCPECKSPAISERDCPLCGGDGLYAIGSDRVCEVCNGIGAIPREWECLGCRHEWDE